MSSRRPPETTPSERQVVQIVTPAQQETYQSRPIVPLNHASRVAENAVNNMPQLFGTLVPRDEFGISEPRAKRSDTTGRPLPVRRTKNSPASVNLYRDPNHIFYDPAFADALEAANAAKVPILSISPAQSAEASRYRDVRFSSGQSSASTLPSNSNTITPTPKSRVAKPLKRRQSPSIPPDDTNASTAGHKYSR